MSRLMIFTDASLCAQGTGAAAWAAWFRHAGWVEGRFRHAAFRYPLTNPNEAEFLGMANALHLAERQGFFALSTSLYLQSDSIETLRRVAHLTGATPIVAKTSDGRPIWPRAHPIGPAARLGAEAAAAVVARIAQAEEIIRRCAARYGPKVYVKHVLGHQPDAKGRFEINRECDRLARATMRQKRRALAAENRTDPVDAETV